MDDIKVSKVIAMNIIFPLRGEEVALAIKTKKIGVGKYNGYGGKQEDGETMIEACSRELETEAGLKANPEDFEKVAVVDFFIHKNDGTVNINRCDIFTVRNFTGELTSSDEMGNPKWFPIKHLPFSMMMLDAKYWIPRILNEERIHVSLHYNEKRTEILGSIHSVTLQQT